MDELFKNAPEIIKAASTNPLALAALIVLILGIIAFFLFRGAREVTRVAVFILTGLSLLTVFSLAFIILLINAELADSPADNTLLIQNETSKSLQAPASVSDAKLSGEKFSTTCVTDSVTCSLVFPDKLPIGTSCNCYTIMGQAFAGTVQ